MRKSRAFVGPVGVVKFREDRLNISVYCISRSVKWSELRGKPGRAHCGHAPQHVPGHYCVMDRSQPPSTSPFPGVTLLEFKPLWKSASSTLSSSKKKPWHKLWTLNCERATAEHVNAGLMITKCCYCQEKQLCLLIKICCSDQVLEVVEHVLIWFLFSFTIEARSSLVR